MRVLSFNILSPIYAAPKWYPGVDLKYLERERRLRRILKFVQTQKSEVDVLAFQEVNPEQFTKLQRLLEPEFVGAISYNDSDYWLDSVLPGFKPEPNGTAIFLRKSLFSQIDFQPVPLETGNRPIQATATDCFGAKYRFLSVHFDSDDAEKRNDEVEALVDQLPSGDEIDVVIGDMNSNTDPSSVLGRTYKKEGFIDLLKIQGRAEATHPFAQWEDDSSYNPVIDHIMVRGPIVPTGARTFSYGIMRIPDETIRLEETLKRTGSDHFAIQGNFELI